MFKYIQPKNEISNLPSICSNYENSNDSYI